MTDDLRIILSKLNTYLADFAVAGYSADKAEEILSLLDKEEGSPVGRIYSVFGCERFDMGAIALGLLVSVSADASRLAYELCGVHGGCITPRLVAAVLFGTRDIAPFTGYLQSYSPLGRLFTGVTPSCNAEMRIRETVSGYALGGALYDDSFLPRADTPAELVPLCSQQEAEKELVSFIEKSDASQPFIIQLVGPDGAGKHTCVDLAFGEMKRRYIPLRLSDDMDSEAMRELTLKLLLSGAIPIVSAVKDTERYHAQLRTLADETGLIIAISGSPIPTASLGTDAVTIRIGLPTLKESCLLWNSLSSAFRIDGSADFAELSGEFGMTPGAIVKALRCADVISGGEPLTTAAIKNGCYRSADADMGGKAVRIDCVFTWDDLVLPAQSKRLLRDACQQVRCHHRVFDGWGFAERMPYGRGVSMIFTGPPGTGKTMAAQVMASELGMEIYKISLANVVSKFIGETEKNLNEIFEKAKLCRCILFFDEADVLFSKRTEVKEANDKYSNMESAFLLQKTEEYNGVVILATNYVQNFDEAFKRRMRFIVDFPFPDAERRREMWHKAFPAKAPIDFIDYDFLVERFELSGSNIRNIALHSAFLAASDNSSGIGMKHVIEAIRNEYAKSGKAFTKAEAGEYYSELRQE